MRIIRRILVRIVVKNDIDRVEGRYIWVLPGEDVFSQGACSEANRKIPSLSRFRMNLTMRSQSPQTPS